MGSRDSQDVALDRLDPLLARLGTLLASVTGSLPPARRAAAERWRADADALRFHLASTATRRARPPLVVVLGGTGTGKSTLVNRLTGHNLSAASFRRTFTAGPVAIVRKADDLPPGWLGVEHVVAGPDELPARGRPGALIIVEGLNNKQGDKETGRPGDGEAASRPSVSVPPPLPVSPSDSVPTLLDTPDLDGDQPVHHAQADRAFRWAQAVLFLVTPEKYQMTELLPYYRLARRYAVPAVYVMNKCEEQAVVDDYATQLRAHGPAPVFVIPRDDATYEPPAEMGLAALRSALSAFPQPDEEARRRGLQHRAADVRGRFTDQILAPLREDRKEADRMIAALRAMVTPEVGVDVNPLTQRLQRRLQQRSILYLMGPGRILDRVRQAPTLLARLPRVAWDYVRKGELSPELLNPAGNGQPQTVPDFKAALADQFAVLQSRIDDVLRSTATGQQWIEGAEAAPAAAAASTDNNPYAAARIDPAEAGRIAEEELGELKAWLEQKWNATPRDTRMLETFLKHLPGGRKLSKWSEAAPYLLTIVLVTHGAFFGHIDLLVLGGYGLATWLTERLSNEVTARTRAANARIQQRFAELAHDQIERVCAWLDRQAPGVRALGRLERAADEMNEAVGV